MPHVSITALLEPARRRGYAVPSLLAGNLEMVTGMIAAAEARQSPLILAFNRHVTPDLPIEFSLPMSVNAAQRAGVPVATFLDHGAGLDDVCHAIRLGVSSVMFDGSHLPYEDNVRQTREIVRMAHAMGVAVEAELGSIGGSALEIGAAVASPEPVGDATTGFTDPALAADFVQRTGVDVLAISFGNVHGVYQPQAPRLDLERVRAIHRRVAVPLAMHGGSGLSDAEYPPIVAAGISKLGYYSAMGLAAVAMLRDGLTTAAPGTLSYHHVIARMTAFFRAETEHILGLAGCAGRATK